MIKSPVYICDDESGICRYLQKMLNSGGYSAKSFTSGEDLLEELERDLPQQGLLLLDVKLADADGLEILRQVRDLHPGLTVVMMTGYGTIESAVKAIKLGAIDYLSKPFAQEHLFALVENALTRSQLQVENRTLKQELRERIYPGTIIIRSPSFRKVYNLALRVAATDSNVLVCGESGTGKEVIAGTIHYHGPRSQRLFLAVNCAALSDNLLESQLFGHLRGSFTGANQNQKGLLEEANCGTLFLDEIAELSLKLQAKLLRVLEKGEYLPIGATRTRQTDVRFIAATNKDLQQEVSNGRFREDLYFRLNVMTLPLPPLRERPEDIEPLVEYFLEGACRKVGRLVTGLTPAALAALKQYGWPGNVRELGNVIERAVILSNAEQIDLDSLPLHLCTSPHKESEDIPSSFSLREAEKVQVTRALKETCWNKSRAARLLGVTRKTLDRKIQEFSLVPSGEQNA